ncbi:type III domain-containing 3B [Octopus vulgaris]|uniref:Type III domain-containing 3B n=1 Tax=Octopus vulgaris TaxID=6645 RepID=A0AA36BTJ3_OCTVU|nr:type III domain-containing 3B [Octopus vulgaris]
MGSKRKKNLSRLQRNKKNYVCKFRSKKNVTSIPEQGNFSTGIHNALPSTSGTLQVTEELHNASNSQLRPYVDNSSDEDIEIMSPEHKRRLNDCLVKLVENMIPDEVLNILLAKKVLTNYEMDTVKSKGIRMAMNEMLISLVTCKPDKAFSVLVEALKRSEQKHLAKLLTSTEYRKRKPAFEGNKDVTEDRKAVQESPISAKVKTRITSQNIQPKGRKILKEKNSLQTFIQTCEKMSDQLKEIRGSQLTKQNLRKPKSDPLPSMSGCKVPFEKSSKKFPNKNISQLASVVDESTDSNSEKMMSEEHKNLLKDNRVELVQNMIANDVLDHLLQKDVLTMSEKDRIKAEGASMNEKLIDTIMCKQDKAFFVFVDALKNTASGRENANAKRMVIQSYQSSILPKTVTPTSVKVELQSEEGEIYNAGSKNILINKPREDNPLISKYDHLLSTSANVKVPEESIKSLPNEAFSQTGSVDESADSEDSDSVKMMSEEHKKLVKDKRVELVQNMIANDVLDHLLQKDVLTMSEKDRIKAEGASMNKKLIDTIMCKPDKAFFVFVDALEKTRQRHLANLLSPAKRRKPASGRENANAKRMVIQSYQSSILPKTVTPTSVKVELQSEEGEIYNAGSKNILINEPREDNPLISKFDQLPSTLAYVEASGESIESLPNEAFSQTGSVDESADGEDSDSVKMMSEVHAKLLKDNRVELVQNMIANDVLDHLLQKNVLTMSEKDRIKAEGASMNEKLIDTIMCKPDKAFFVFVAALKNTGQPHLADLLSPAKKRKPETRGPTQSWHIERSENIPFSKENLYIPSESKAVKKVRRYPLRSPKKRST